MQCPACQQEVNPQNAFCNHCGAPLSPAAVGGAPAGAWQQHPASPPPAYTAQPIGAGAGLSDNSAAAIAYLTIIPAIVFLVLEPYNKVPLVRFHAWQSIALGVTAFVLQAVISIAQMGMHFIPGVFLLFGMVHLVLAVGLFLAWLMAILKAVRGEWHKLPVLGDFAERQARS